LLFRALVEHARRRNLSVRMRCCFEFDLLFNFVAVLLSFHSFRRHMLS